MKVEAFSLRNYRSFLDRTRVELRPLTLLFGYNSAGKSALLRSLPLIAASCNEQNGSPVALGSPVARGAAFQDLLPHPSLNPQRELAWELAFRDDASGGQTTGVVSWTIRDLPELRRQVVEKLELRETVGLDELKATWMPAVTGPGRLGTDYSLVLRNQTIEPVDLRFQGLIPRFETGTVTLSNEVRASLGSIQKVMESFQSWGQRVQWLTSVRDLPRRSFPWRGSAPDTIDPHGDGAADVLAYDQLEGSHVIEEVSKWYERNLGWRLKVVPVDDQFKLVLEPLLNSPVQVNLADAGEGLIQVLPVLVAAARTRRPGLSSGVLAVEEPESHLHPRLHAALAERFCELAALSAPPQIILETHSENMLLRIQLAVADGQLDPGRVVVYWVWQYEDGRSIAEPIFFDELGRPQGNWPPGVFQEDLDQARKLVTKQRERLGR